MSSHLFELRLQAENIAAFARIMFSLSVSLYCDVLPCSALLCGHNEIFRMRPSTR